jgi:hypothetical protein
MFRPFTLILSRKTIFFGISQKPLKQTPTLLSEATHGRGESAAVFSVKVFMTATRSSGTD